MERDLLAEYGGSARFVHSVRAVNELYPNVVIELFLDIFLSDSRRLRLQENLVQTPDGLTMSGRVDYLVGGLERPDDRARSWRSCGAPRAGCTATWWSPTPPAAGSPCCPRPRSPR